MSYRDDVSLSMVGQDIKVNSKVMKGTRGELIKQEAMLDKYKKREGVSKAQKRPQYKSKLATLVKYT